MTQSSGKSQLESLINELVQKATKGSNEKMKTGREKGAAAATAFLATLSSLCSFTLRQQQQQQQQQRK